MQGCPINVPRAPTQRPIPLNATENAIAHLEETPHLHSLSKTIRTKHEEIRKPFLHAGSRIRPTLGESEPLAAAPHSQKGLSVGGTAAFAGFAAHIWSLRTCGFVFGHQRTGERGAQPRTRRSGLGCSPHWPSRSRTRERHARDLRRRRFCIGNRRKRSRRRAVARISAHSRARAGLVSAKPQVAFCCRAKERRSPCHSGRPQPLSAVSEGNPRRPELAAHLGAERRRSLPSVNRLLESVGK